MAKVKAGLAAGATANDKFLGGINVCAKGVEGKVPSEKKYRPLETTERRLRRLFFITVCDTDHAP